jgi:hypothetical protein
MASDIVPAIAHTATTSTPTTKTMCRRITMGKNKNDFEAPGSGMKKEVCPNRVPLAVDMARLMHENWMPCGN